MTAEQQEWIRRELGSRIDALEMALNGLDHAKPDSLDAVRKLLQTLSASTRSAGLVEIGNAAMLAAGATNPELKTRVAGFIQMLREQARQSSGSASAILMMGSDPAVLPELERRLAGAGRTIVKVATVKEAEAILVDREVTFIVTDLFLPDQDVRQFISSLRLRPLMAAIPILVVTSKVATGEADLSDLLQDVDAFFGSPIDFDQIQVAMEQRLRRAHDRIRAAHRDPLTGLLNRAAFGEYFERAIQHHRHTKEPVAVAVMKIDRYQELCDQFGAQTGEKMLRHFGTVLSRHFRATDVVARWSGCEFMALFPGEDNRGATRAMERIRQALAKDPFNFPDGSVAPLKIYAGVSILPDQANLTGAIDQADKYMHQARAEGGDRVVSSEDPSPKRKERVVLITPSDTTSKVLLHHLTREGMEPQHFARVDAACLKFLETTKCHLIAIDDAGTVPLDAGTLRQIRALPRQSRTPILLLTAREEVAANALEMGASDFVTKPLDLMVFVKTARRLLTRGLTDAARGEGQESLLVISNDLHSLMMFGTAVQKKTGFVVLLARGVKDGVLQLNKRRPSVCVIDIKPRSADWQQLVEALTVLRPAPALLLIVEPEDYHYVRTIKTPAIKGILQKPLAPLTVAGQIQDASGMMPAAAAGRPETAEILKEEVDRVIRVTVA